MGGAEIAVNSAAEIAGIEAENVMLTGARLTQGAHAFSVEAGIEFTLVGVESGSQAHQRGGKQSAQQNERGDCREMACYFPEQAFPERQFPYEHGAS